MRTRLRLGAAASVGLGALLLATVLASPALAWHSNVTVSARCLDGQVRIHYTVEAWEKDHEATVDVSYKLNGEVTELESDDHFFGPKHNQFSGHFDLPAGTTGTITFLAVAHWDSGETSHNKGSDELPPAEKCDDSGSTTTTTTEEPTTTTTLPEEEPTTTTVPDEEVAPSTTLAPTTTEAAVGAATSTTGGGELPFTGATAGPMLIAGIALVAGGTLFLMVSRVRDRHATR
jgi:hypothetical protein